ncbi:methyltransferase family protein [Mycolicibacterium thermoresistibile]
MYARTAIYSVVGLALFGALLFWPAGTFDFWQGWALLAVMVACTIPYTVYLAVKMPDTLQRRLRSGATAESRKAQKIAILAMQLAALGILALGGLDHRFGWSRAPVWVCVVGLVLTTAGLVITIGAVLQNSWAAATITTESDQQVVSTGMYAVVRHPLYTGAVIVFFGMPLALGSYWALLLFVVAVAALIIRIFDEEELLHAELPGYPEYTRTVRHRLVPYLW